MIEVECREMTVDEQIALASAISDGLSGRVLAVIKDTKIVIDTLSGKISPGDVIPLVRSFVSKRKDARLYSVELVGEQVLIHSPDPLARSRGRKDTGQLLPPNLLKCPFCNFVTPYQELYDIHFRSHGFGA